MRISLNSSYHSVQFNIRTVVTISAVNDGETFTVVLSFIHDNSVVSVVQLLNAYFNRVNDDSWPDIMQVRPFMSILKYITFIYCVTVIISFSFLTCE